MTRDDETRIRDEIKKFYADASEHEATTVEIPLWLLGSIDDLINEKRRRIMSLVLENSSLKDETKELYKELKDETSKPNYQQKIELLEDVEETLTRKKWEYEAMARGVLECIKEINQEIEEQKLNERSIKQ